MENRISGLALTLLTLGSGVISAQAEDSQAPPVLHLQQDSRLSLDQSPEHGIWKAGTGEGFKAGTKEAGFAFGAGLGMSIFGSKQAHDLALGKIHYGWIFTDVLGEEHWYRGNWELLGEGFGGVQYRPHHAYVAGGTAIFRYDFATGTCFIPFVDIGGGLTATDIGKPDLGGTFQFNLQAGGGVNYFWRDNSAITFEYRLLHISNAGIERPNLGLNTSMFYLGMSWFF
ncbi:acyloxyacyl hydrolase [Pedosphaera parvula]|uniref:Orn/DAP/Arg decarboxylase 2 n=1 Tax=Pedosphaera parvula (strain Ellin514) TaxID=320771 RepID=B9XRE2_PEDPL|nr:acyloxyacyl hydrolase [Pedosphaera parvula]EEF57576.1 Orn/DAP/Arg decarboxylase 2 [Pedosphaera parvula Ellin514]